MEIVDLRSSEHELLVEKFKKGVQEILDMFDENEDEGEVPTKD